MKNNSKFCLLCNKEFASTQNLKRHNNYAHKLCEPPAYVCNFCHTGFVNWDDYEHHHSQRLLKTFSRKKKKRTAQPEPAVNPSLSPMSPEEAVGGATIKSEEESDWPDRGEPQHSPQFYVDQPVTPF